MTTTDLVQEVVTWDRETLDAFYDLMELQDPLIDAEAIDAHWHWRGRLWCDGRPLCLYRGRVLGVQRVVWIQFYRRDPRYLRRLHTLCGVASCCNPKHLVCAK